MGAEGLKKDLAEELTGENDCKTGEHKDSWWCDGLQDFKEGDFLICTYYYNLVFKKSYEL